MKPLHVGLLVIGAALAGGLAVRMSQPPPVSAPPAAEQRVVVAPPIVKPAPAPQPAPLAVAEAEAPPPVYAEPPHAERPKPLPPAPKPESKKIAKAAPPPPAEPLVLPKPVPYQEPAPVPAPPPQAAEAPPIREVTIQAGSAVPVRLLQTISTEHAVAGDTFQATLAEPLVADGWVVAERGARVSGRVLDAKTSGRFSGASEIRLSLSLLQTADGQRIGITTEPWGKQSEANARERNDAARIGGGAALGAIIGALAGGGKGAAIGAGAGGAAGAGSVAAQRPKPLEIPSETLIRFRLASRVTITERPL